jgi:hypothetical protein
MSLISKIGDNNNKNTSNISNDVFGTAYNTVIGNVTIKQVNIFFNSIAKFLLALKFSIQHLANSINKND